MPINVTSQQNIQPPPGFQARVGQKAESIPPQELAALFSQFNRMPSSPMGQRGMGPLPRMANFRPPMGMFQRNMRAGGWGPPIGQMPPPNLSQERLSMVGSGLNIMQNNSAMMGNISNMQGAQQKQNLAGGISNLRLQNMNNSINAFVSGMSQLLSDQKQLNQQVLRNI